MLKSVAAMALLGGALAISATADDGDMVEVADILLPPGFTATVFSDDASRPRHMTVRDDGTVYAALMRAQDDYSIVALRDNDGDGVADETHYFGSADGGTGIGIDDGYLYFASDTALIRYALAAGEVVPSAEPQVIATFPSQRPHAAKPFSFDGEGNVYVTIGAPSNACQQRSRSPESPGQTPCPFLDHSAGIWKFDVNRTGQTDVDGERVATGVRNAMAQAWNTDNNHLYFLSHGRDQLSGLWPEFYDDETSAELPSEEMHKVVAGANAGWPYTYWNHMTGKRYVAPEYGGDGKTVAEAGKYNDPVFAAPGHWAPNDLMFYTGDMLPERYKGGAFIAFHGSWNRAPLPQGGYKIVFVPLNDGVQSGEMEVFADGFAGVSPLLNPRDADHRPTGIAQGLDGELYVSDDQGGRIWRIVYEGD